MSCLVVPRLAALVLAVVVPFAHAQATVPFDPRVPLLPAEVRLPRWESAREALARDLPVMASCLADAGSCATGRLGAWRAMMLDAQGSDWAGKLEAVNRHLNGVPYRRDHDQHGVIDRWSGPLEFLAVGGDCEDYAIAKYASLQLLGLPVSAMRIVVLEDEERALAHAVLAVREGSRVWVLDNQVRTVVAVEALPHYAPYYAVNDENRWLHRVPGQPATVASAR